jgi:hypothetical protein
MDENLRFEPGRKERSSNHSRFSDSMGILRAAEKCNGSGLQETALSWWKYVSKLSSDAK